MKIVEITSSNVAENLASLQLLSKQLDPISLIQSQRRMELMSKKAKSRRQSPSSNHSNSNRETHQKRRRSFADVLLPSNSNSSSTPPKTITVPHDNDDPEANQRHSLLSPRSRASLNLNLNLNLKNLMHHDNRVSLELGAGETSGEDPFGMVRRYLRWLFFSSFLSLQSTPLPNLTHNNSLRSMPLDEAQTRFS